MRGVVAIVCLVALAACKLGATFDDARFRCSETSPCPDGRTCRDGYCEAGGQPADAEPAEAAVLGDVLLLTFDDGGLQSFRDRSGHRFDCSGGGADTDAGVFGSAVILGPSNFLQVPDQPELHLGQRLTIEAWLWRDAAGDIDPILGDYSVDEKEVAAEYALEVTTDDRLRFVTNDACQLGAGASVLSATDQPVPVAEWVHVAVVWDGAEVRFYLDGQPAGAEPLDARPCELARSLRLGRHQGSQDELTMIGRLDEVKLSSIAKSEADIRASMDFDSTELVPRCGDLIVEEEGCDGDSLCCDPAACASAPDGEPCGSGSSESCQLGVCQVAPGRSAEGLVALYDFEEGGGTTVVDSSGVAPQVNLVIAEPGAVIWGDGYLDIESETIVQSSANASKIAEACAASGELTVEAWVEAATADQAGQIVAMGNGTNSELGLAQYNASWNGRVRSSGTSSRGTPHLPSALGDAGVGLTHLVLRRDAAGVRNLFVDGRERGLNVAPGSLDQWTDHRIAVGDEPGGSDPWRGRIHRIAIYCRALSDLEVAAAYLAGAGPSAGPGD